MKKIKTFLLVALSFFLLFFMCIGIGVTPAIAEEAPEEPPAVTDEVVDENSMPALVERFTEYLKEKYGDDYEYYYNQIMEKYGSIEQYLLSFTDKLPEEYQDGWTQFLAWLHKYSVVWVPTLVFIILIILAIIGKNIVKKFYKKAFPDFRKGFESIVDKKVNDKLNEKITPIAEELNLQSAAIGSIMRSQQALLGPADKFADVVKDLEKNEKELTNNG